MGKSIVKIKIERKNFKVGSIEISSCVMINSFGPTCNRLIWTPLSSQVWRFGGSGKINHQTVDDKTHAAEYMSKSNIKPNDDLFSRRSQCKRRNWDS